MSEKPNKGSSPEPQPNDNPANRRSFLSWASTAAMGGSLIAGYGTLAFMAGKFLYPSQSQPKLWLYVGKAEDVQENAILKIETPSGQNVTIRRRATTGESSDFLALSSICPHLGCQVHWEGQNNRFFCPCHNGVFDPSGNPVSGPPADAGQTLSTYPIRIDNGLIFIEVPEDPLA